MKAEGWESSGCDPERPAAAWAMPPPREVVGSWPGEMP